MSKAADAFRTISEVAGELGVPKHVLRFWEAKFPQIRPMKRGGGRRYYRPGDMELLKGIRHLLHAEGYTIKGVQKILREQGIDAVKHFGRPDLTADAGGDRARRPRAADRPLDLAPRSATSAASDAEPAPSAGTSSRARRPAPEGANSIDALIAELEACRKILQAETAAVTARAAGRTPKRARAGRE